MLRAEAGIFDKPLPHKNGLAPQHCVQIELNFSESNKNAFISAKKIIIS
jgi:hypothetical protein